MVEPTVEPLAHVTVGTSVLQWAERKAAMMVSTTVVKRVGMLVERMVEKKVPRTVENWVELLG